MPAPVRLSKSDARRALVRHHFAPRATIAEVFDHLRSIQFDPIAPVGCNHDLVLQARIDGYQVGDWEKAAYEDRLVYDGWDKQASLVPFEGWPVRRIFHKWHGARFKHIFDDHPQAVQAILKEIEMRGPLMPKECEFQERKAEWKDSWHGPNLSKQTLRALWHSGLVMTTGRRKGHHVYDLSERVVPPKLFSTPPLSINDTVRELTMERHRAVGILRPNAQAEVWSLYAKAADRYAAIAELVAQGELVPVDLEGMKTHATPEFLSHLDSPSLNRGVVFVAALDQFMWDRTMIGHVFDFEYIWEIYVPEAKRKWGYYVLPVLYGDALVARIELWCRKGVLEIRRWHWEPADPGPGFQSELELALRKFMIYCSANSITVDAAIDPKIQKLAKSLGRSDRAPSRSKTNQGK